MDGRREVAELEFAVYGKRKLCDDLAGASDAGRLMGIEVLAGLKKIESLSLKTCSRQQICGRRNPFNPQGLFLVQAADCEQGPGDDSIAK